MFDVTHAQSGWLVRLLVADGQVDAGNLCKACRISAYILYTSIYIPASWAATGQAKPSAQRRTTLFSLGEDLEREDGSSKGRCPV